MARGQRRWEHWNKATDRARSLFVRLVGVTPARVAVGATVSGLVGLIAASVPDGTRVVVPEPDFGSLLYPWLVQAERLRVETVPLAELAQAVRRGTGVVAFSAVQSSTGELADWTRSRRRRARPARSPSSMRLTPAAGSRSTPLRFDAVAAAAYKWLLAPRGTAFLAISERLLERTTPLAAGWFASERPYVECYAPRFGSRRPRGAWTSRPPGSRGSAANSRSRSCSTPASSRSTSTISRSRTASAPGSDCPPATRPSSRSTPRRSRQARARRRARRYEQLGTGVVPRLRPCGEMTSGSGGFRRGPYHEGSTT